MIPIVSPTRKPISTSSSSSPSPTATTHNSSLRFTSASTTMLPAPATSSLATLTASPNTLSNYFPPYNDAVQEEMTFFSSYSSTSAGIQAESLSQTQTLVPLCKFMLGFSKRDNEERRGN
ncbi:hypothetical protein GYH30_014188 [Glycine max]|nr:hypothetical protein GYH30_014188 [Glycine max]